MEKHNKIFRQIGRPALFILQRFAKLRILLSSLVDLSWFYRFDHSSLLAGLTLLCIQRVDGMKYVSTFFELDFDTPWDHKILQESLFGVLEIVMQRSKMILKVVVWYWSLDILQEESEERRRDSVLTDFSSLNATVRMSVQKVSLVLFFEVVSIKYTCALETKVRRSLRFRNNQITEERVTMAPQQQGSNHSSVDPRSVTSVTEWREGECAIPVWQRIVF